LSDYTLADRKALYAREQSLLAPYAMASSRSRGRLHDELEPEFRTAFQRDRDRIVHSTAFRRLEYKTQVFVNHEGDHYRTRLTHTLEVAQISRSIARVLRLNEDLVEAIALSHDLGHPPFGHAGEEALDRLLADWGGFDHNLQTLWVVDRLEKRYPEFDGLNLSWEVRESIVKHGRPGGDALRAQVRQDFEPSGQPLLEAQLADLADSLAYTTHDIDDGLRAGFVSLEQLREVELWGEAERDMTERNPPMDPKTLVARTVSHLIDRQVRDLITATHDRLHRLGVDSIEKVRTAEQPLVGYTEPMAMQIKEMGAFLNETLYRHYRTLKMTEKAKRFITSIFEEYYRSPGQLPPAFAARVAQDGGARVIGDYIAGMTDRYCQDEYKRLFHPFERM
jgi:dGTPase